MKYLYKRPPYNYHRVLSAVLLTVPAEVSLPKSVDLRALMHTPRNQGQEGCCSGFSTAALREGLISAILGNTSKTPVLSPAYLYARTRIAEGTFPHDVGATVCDEINTLVHFGVCPENVLPYSGEADEGPTMDADVAAAEFRVMNPKMVDNLQALELALASNHPVVFGMPVFESFEQTTTDGMVKEPDYAKERMLGGHAMLAVGYDREKGIIIVRNSWGAEWGDGGYCYLPVAMFKSWFEAWTAQIAVPVVHKRKAVKD